MTAKSAEYTNALHAAGGVSGDEFESWKGLCRTSRIRPRDLEKITNGCDLIELLEKRDLVNQDNVSLLIDQMNEIGRLQIANKLREYGEKWALSERTQVSEYNRLLNNINSSLSDEELINVKFLCRSYSGFTKDNRNKMKSMLDVFQYLEQALILDKTETNVLEDLMKQIDRLDLAKEIQLYKAKFIENSGPGIAQPSDCVDLSEEFDIVVRYIGRDWRQLARRLRVLEADIDAITTKHPYDLREQSRESLKIWQDKNKSSATREALLSTLRRCEFNYVADVMEKKIEEV